MNCAAFVRDDRGAIMLIAVFLAIFGVGLLYYLIGVSASVLFREKMQDAADAAVLSTAIVHARGMNLIVLVNIIMAALLSVLVTVKLIETLAIIGVGIALGLSWVTMGGSLVAIPPLNTVRSSMQEVYETLKPDVFEALSALHDVSDGVRDATPGVALILAQADIESGATVPETHGVVFGTRRHSDLPVEDDEFSVLCGKAGGLPAQLAEQALKPLPGVSEVMGLLVSPMNSLASSLSQWFCGDGSGSPPAPYQQTIEHLFPRTEAAKACEDDASSGHLSDARGATNRKCTESHADEDAATPEKLTGECQRGHDCSLGGPYDAHVTLAREQCASDYPIQPLPHTYLYQIRAGEVEYEWNGKAWMRGEPVYQAPVAAETNNPPCGPAELHPAVAEGYNLTVHRNGNVADVLPVCSNEVAPTRIPKKEDGDVARTVRFTEVRHILGCKRQETKNIDLSDAERAGEGVSDKAPKRVLQKDDEGNSVTLGDENFQIRAILWSGKEAGAAEKMMRLTLWNQQNPDNPLSLIRPLGKYAVAQAEFFYDDNEPRSEWLWNMNWRARLRRFRLPTGGALDKFDEFCRQLPSGCGSIIDPVKKLGALMAH